MGFWRKLFGGGEEPVAPVKAPPPPAPVTSKWPDVFGHTMERDGRLTQATPKVDVWIQGVPCKANQPVTFHRNGAVQTAWLALPHTVDGEAFPAGVLVMMSGEGKLSDFVRELEAPRTWEQQGVTIPTGSEVVVEEGQLRRATLAAAIELDGMALPAQTQLTFGDSGKLSHVDAPDDLELRGVLWSKSETVIFEFGVLREGWPAVDGVCRGIPYKAHEILRFHDNGAPARCILPAETTLDGVPCAEETRIYLDEDGHLLEGVLARDCTLAGVPVAAGATVLLDGGVPAALTPREDVELDGVWCAQEKLVELVDGKLARGVLARPHAFGAWALPAGSVFVLDGDTLVRFIATDPPGLAGRWRVEVETGMKWPTAGDRFGDQVHLREETTIAGLVAHANTAIELDADGSTRSVVLARDQRVRDWLVKAKTRVRFHAGGAPAQIHLVDDTTIGGVPRAAARTQSMVMNDIETTYREYVRLNPDGTVNFAQLAHDAVVSCVPLRGGETIGCHPGGALQFGKLTARWTHADGSRSPAS